MGAIIVWNTVSVERNIKGRYSLTDISMDGIIQGVYK